MPSCTGGRCAQLCICVCMWVVAWRAAWKLNEANCVEDSTREDKHTVCCNNKIAHYWKRATTQLPYCCVQMRPWTHSVLAEGPRADDERGKIQGDNGFLEPISHSCLGTMVMTASCFETASVLVPLLFGGDTLVGYKRVHAVVWLDLDRLLLGQPSLNSS